MGARNLFSVQCCRAQFRAWHMGAQRLYGWVGGWGMNGGWVGDGWREGGWVGRFPWLPRMRNDWRQERGWYTELPGLELPGGSDRSSLVGLEPA